MLPKIPVNISGGWRIGFARSTLTATNRAEYITPSGHPEAMDRVVGGAGGAWDLPVSILAATNRAEYITPSGHPEAMDEARGCRTLCFLRVRGLTFSGPEDPL